MIPDLSRLSRHQKLQLLEVLEEKERRAEISTAKNDLIQFAHKVYPNYSVGAHHRHMAQIFKDVANGKKRRVIINIAPRMGKSELTSYLFPAWFLGQHPKAKIIMATHTSGLSEDFGRRVRNLIATQDYADVFPQTRLAEDSKGAGTWSTAAGGQYYAVGVGGALAGRGADLLVIDDPHALEVNTPIPTPRGFVKIQDLRVGDEVFGPDGLPVKVVGKSEVRHDRELYAATTDDKEVIYCDGGHLWTYHSETSLKKAHLVKTETARALAEWSKTNAPYLPRHAAVQYPEAALPIDPYVLGAWLGDGTSSSGKMTSHPDDAPFMRGEFAAAGYETADQTDAYNFNAFGLMKQLRALGVLGNKHIPEAYLTASVPQRMALLQGLMDTDGTVTSAGECSFQNTNMRLASGVRELLHSLGFKAKLRVYFDTRQRYKTRQADYRVNFRMADAFRMPRKNVRACTSEDKRRRALRVEPTGRRGSVQCITVDRPDGLFLAGRGYVVTHNSEQDVASGSKIPFEQAWSWYQTGPRQRLMWGGAIIVVATRWSLIDLTARLIDYQVKNPRADQWELIEFPAILNEGEPNEKSLWPEKWPLEELQQTRATIEPRYWNAQYMQNPTAEEGALIKREYWREWTDEDPPFCKMVIQTWDTAHDTKTSNDPSACTTWGVFDEVIEEGKDAGKTTPSLILLDAFKKRMEFPELKAMALEYYDAWEPEAFIIEKKASGGPLLQELRAMGIPAQEFSPSRGNDKTVRVNAVTDIFKSGRVWAPKTRWAQEVIEECAAFPSGAHDDYVDTTTMAVMRFRQGGFITLDTDWKDPPKMFKSSRRAGYY